MTKLLLVVLSLVLLTGKVQGSGGDWCESIPWVAGKLVDEPEADWLQLFQLGAYVHWQSGFVDGEAGGRDFWYGRALEWRRLRAVVKARAFDAVNFKAHLNMVQDDGRTNGGVEFDYFAIFQAELELELHRIWQLEGWDSLSVFYGKRKVHELSEELDTSINSILTVERSSLNSHLLPFRRGTTPTGAWMKGSWGGNHYSLSLFSTDTSREFSDWKNGVMLIGGWRRDFAKHFELDQAFFSLAVGWQVADEVRDQYVPWEWMVAPWARFKHGRAGLGISGAIGHNEGPDVTTGGSFYGWVVLPSWWLVEEKLQLVGRYQVMASEAPNGVQMAFRYGRDAGLPANEGIPSLSSGRGDFHQSFYAGLNWIIYPKRIKMQAGLEWEMLESRGVDVYRGLTGWFATRVVF